MAQGVHLACRNSTGWGIERMGCNMAGLARETLGLGTSVFGLGFQNTVKQLICHQPQCQQSPVPSLLISVQTSDGSHC